MHLHLHSASAAAKRRRKRIWTQTLFFSRRLFVLSMIVLLLAAFSLCWRGKEWVEWEHKHLCCRSFLSRFRSFSLFVICPFPPFIFLGHVFSSLLYQLMGKSFRTGTCRVRIRMHSTLIPVPLSADNPRYLHCGPKCLPRHIAHGHASLPVDGSHHLLICSSHWWLFFAAEIQPLACIWDSWRQKTTMACPCRIDECWQRPPGPDGAGNLMAAKGCSTRPRTW